MQGLLNLYACICCIYYQVTPYPVFRRNFILKKTLTFKNRHFSGCIKLLTSLRRPIYADKNYEYEKTEFNISTTIIW